MKERGIKTMEDNVTYAYLNSEVINDKLHEYRMTQQTLARMAGIADSTLNNYLLRGSRAKMQNVERICQILGLSVAEATQEPQREEPAAVVTAQTAQVDTEKIIKYLTKLIQEVMNVRTPIQEMAEVLKEQIIECRKELAVIKANSIETKEEIRFLRGQLPKRT